MINKLIFILFISFSFKGVCQIELLANQVLPNFFSPNTQVDSTVNLSDFPENIQTKSMDLLKWYTGEFYDSIYFIKGQRIDLETLQKNGYFKDTTSFDYLATNEVIPAYELYFGLTDRSINIHRIILKLSFDEFGQVLEFQWPPTINKKKEFIPSDQIITALNKITKDSENKVPSEVNFTYNDDLKNFVWEFVFDLNSNASSQKIMGVTGFAISIVPIPAFQDEK